MSGETNDLRLSQMLDMQRELVAQHPEWVQRNAEGARSLLLWMVGEIGEVIDIVKKHDPSDYLDNGKERRHLVEECCDVMMYFMDVLDCFDISPEEFTAEYRKKNEYNKIRDYGGR